MSAATAISPDRPDAAGRTLRRARLTRELAGAATAALLALAAAAWSLKLWQADLSVPFRYASDDDTLFYVSLLKGLAEHGTYLVNHALGAPFGQELFDFPQGADDLNLLLARALALAGGAVAAGNLFYLLTFPLVAAVAHLVMRRLGASQAAAAVCGALFALLPYHFFRADSHLFLSAYFATPLAAYLFILVTDGRPPFTRRGGPAPRALAWATPRSAATVTLCVVVGSTGLYYAVFGVVLLVGGALVAAAGRRGRAAVAGGLAAAGLIVAVIAVNLIPSFAYRLAHGDDPAVTRTSDAGDELAMSPAYLVLPPLHDRIAPLRHITERYSAHTAPQGYCEQCYASVGLVGDAGLAGLALVGIGAVFGVRRGRAAHGTLRCAACGVLVCLAVGVTGALASLLRVFVSADIRAWNRLSVTIAFFALLASALLLDRALARARRRFAPLAVLLAAGVWAFGVADQTSGFFVPAYGADQRAFASDARLVSAAQATLPRGAAVLSLPYVPFPEGYQPFFAPGLTVPYDARFNFEYDSARPYIQARTLRFSYGAMKGRPADWEAALAAEPLDLSLGGAALAGFDGAILDRRGYPNAQRLVAEIARRLGTSPVWSPARDLAFLDLRPYAARLARALGPQREAVRQAIMRPLTVTCSAGRLAVENPGARERSATLLAGLRGAGSVRIRVGRGTPSAVRARDGRIALPVRLPPGHTAIFVSGAAGASLVAPVAREEALAILTGPGPGGTLPRTGIIGPPCAAVPIGR